MLEPTDRVLAKIIMRGWLEAEYTAGVDAITYATKFTTAIFPLVKDNRNLLVEVLTTLAEVADEAMAEATGSAVLNTNPYPLDAPQPVAAPWNADAGSGC